MGKKYKPLLILIIFLAAVGAAAIYINGHNVAVLNPAGEVASKERRLIIEATLLMLIVVIPVYFFTFFIAIRYREDNHRAKYTPEWDGNRKLELFWWAVPILVISILGVITYQSSHTLDPFKPLASNSRPLKIQVVALQWKWLFIYPEQNIASVNLAEFPVDRPINFEITSDAPMNSFWIPQLAGQIYAMSGMSTMLHVMADKTGNYEGVSANISGRGFANMHFTARAASNDNFTSWLKQVKKLNNQLSIRSYNNLSQPSYLNRISYYSFAQSDLYDLILQKYTRPAPPTHSIDYYVALSNSGGVR